MELKDVTKKYFINNEECFSLNKINVKFEQGKFYGIIGHSGSGKTTLINILGLVDSFDSGKYYLDNKLIEDLSEDEKATLRLNHFGFVFQSFHLNPKLTALENVIIPMIINKNILKKERKEKAINLLNELGLESKINHLPSELSTGEQQRVAIARSLANNPKVIIADEPTGNLDKENEKIVFDIFRKLVDKEKKCVIVVSHNDVLKEYADVIYHIENGNLKVVK